MVAELPHIWEDAALYAIYNMNPAVRGRWC